MSEPRISIVCPTPTTATLLHILSSHGTLLDRSNARFNHKFSNTNIHCTISGIRKWRNKIPSSSVAFKVCILSKHAIASAGYPGFTIEVLSTSTTMFYCETTRFTVRMLTYSATAWEVWRWFSSAIPLNLNLERLISYLHLMLSYKTPDYRCYCY